MRSSADAARARAGAIRRPGLGLRTEITTVSESWPSSRRESADSSPATGTRSGSFRHSRTAWFASFRLGAYDGEIVCLDDEGRPRFNALMFRRSSPVFAAFDVLWLAGQDLKVQPLLERKRRLAAVVPARSRSLLFVQHLEARGTRLFGKVCEQDLEGVVGKWAKGRYLCDGQTTSWVKVKNPAYSLAVGRYELFEGRRRGEKARPRPRRLVLA